MDYAYLVASLPTLKFGTPPPLSMAEFVTTCEGQLSRRDMADLYAVATGHPESAHNPHVRWYVDRDRQLRSAVAKARAARRGADVTAHVREYAGFDMSTEQAGSQALSIDDPLERALALDRHRWRLLDQMVSVNDFSSEAVFAFAFRLQLLEQWQRRTDAAGEAAAVHIVDHNLSGLQL